jgi:predicted membrane protein
MRLVLGLVNASMLVSIVANMVYFVADPRWLKALGDIVTTAVGIAALVRMWQVFPFDFSGSSFDWALVVRVAMGVAIGGSAIALVVAFVSFVKSVGRPAS